MFIYYLAVLLVVLRASAKNDTTWEKDCNGVIYRGTYYEKIKLFEGVWRPTNLLMHKYSGTLYFSYVTTNNTIDFVIKSCHMETRNCKEFSEVRGGHAIAYDRWGHLIYFGGNDGIYTYNVKNNELKSFAEQGKTIWGIAIRRNFFYIDYPKKQLYTLVNGRFYKVSNVGGDKIDVFFVSSSLDTYFCNRTALYVIDAETKLTNYLSDKIKVTQIIEDMYGDIYFSAIDGVYMYSMGMGELTKIASIDRVYGIAFAEIVTSGGESYQLIYSDEYSINMLYPSDREEMCERQSVIKRRK